MSSSNGTTFFHFTSAMFPIVGGGLNVIGIFIFKYIYLQRARMQPHEITPLYQNPLWVFGVFSFMLGGIFVLVPPPSENALVPNNTAIADVVALFAGLFVSRFVIKEPQSGRDLLGYLTVMAGASLGLWQVEPIIVTLVVYIVYCLLVIIFVFLGAFAITFFRGKARQGLGHASATVPRKILPILYAAETAMLESLISIPVFVLLAVSKEFPFFYWLIFFFGFFITMAAEMFWLHVALKDYDVLYIVAMYHLSIRTIHLIISAVFGAFNGMTQAHIVVYAVLPTVGVVLMVLGAYILSLRENFSAYHALVGDDLPQPSSGPPRVRSAEYEMDREAADPDSDSSDADDLQPQTQQEPARNSTAMTSVAL